MSSKSIVDNVIVTVSKGPLIVLVLLGLGVWQASKMAPEQIATIEHLVAVLNNFVGLAFYLVLILFLIYALILWPVGKFLSGVVSEFFDAQKVHTLQQEDHIVASKNMYHNVNSIADSCVNLKSEITRLADRLDKFYGKE